MMHWASKDPSKECIKLFYVDVFGVKRISSKARDLIRQTLQTQQGRLLSEKELNQFFEIMKSKSPLEQQLFLESPKADTVKQIDAPLGPIDIVIPSIRNRIRDAYKGLNVFSYCSHKNKEKVMIPSFSMMQTFLDVKFKTNAVRINPVLGLSKVSDIRENGLNQSRDMALRFPQIFTPDEADLYEARETDFIYHDFFHAVVVSSSASEDQIRFISIADAIKKTPTKEEEKKTLIKWHEQFIDMELTIYYQSIFNKQDEPLFLIHLYKKIQKINYTLGESFHLSKETLDEIAKNIGKVAFSDPVHKEELNIYIKNLKESLKKRKIKIDSLKIQLKTFKTSTTEPPPHELNFNIPLKESELALETALFEKNTAMVSFFEIMGSAP